MDHLHKPLYLVNKDHSKKPRAGISSGHRASEKRLRMCKYTGNDLGRKTMASPLLFPSKCDTPWSLYRMK